MRVFGDADGVEKRDNWVGMRTFFVGTGAYGTVVKCTENGAETGKILWGWG